MIARSPALNPASVPFFPGGMPRLEEGDQAASGLGFKLPPRPERQDTSSSVSVSSSDYRSVKSSPSPPPASDPAVHHMRSDSSGSSRQLPDDNVQGSLESTPDSRQRLGTPKDSTGDVQDGEDTPGPMSINWTNGFQLTGRIPFNDPTGVAPHDTRFTPPVPPSGATSRSSSYNFFKSSSPVSSTGSVSVQSSGIDQTNLSFEAQIKASPTINDLLDRLSRCEYSNREVQRELGEVHRKVNLLLERSLGSIGSEPEFKNPFAPPSVNGRSLTPTASLSPAAALAPHQNPSVKADDISQLSQRLNTLTTSVGQLLALQTQQHVNAVASAFPPQVHPGQHQSSIDIAPNQPISSPPLSHASMLGHGLPNRPELRPSPRTPNPPMRTWSAGTLELPMRPSDATINRQDLLMRDKRRSVAGLLRRDSAGVLDSPGESWLGGSPRDTGPVVSKWEHLPLSPELLRSLSQFGVGPPNKIQQRALPFLLRGADIIAQAPPTQERIAAYVIPAIHVALTNINGRPPNRGPIVVMISTTVDQATQAQRMIRDLGSGIGVRSALGVGTTGPNSDIVQEIRLLQQNMPHIICGTPQKLHALFTSPGGLVGSEVRFLVLDEVDQLIARNLHEFVFNIVKILPPPRSRSSGGGGTPVASPTPQAQTQFGPFDAPNVSSSLGSPFQNNGRRFSGVPTPSGLPSENNPLAPQPVERQTALFSNTVPQDVLNLANAIQLREPVRVLVRRDGNVTHADTSQGARGLRQFYLYLAFTAGGRSDSVSKAGGGLGIIGSGRGASSSAETAQAREWKLDALADLFDDVEVTQAIVHVGGMTALDAVVYKLASIGLEAVPLHGDMNAGTKLAALNKFRGSASSIMRQPPPATKVLVVYDVQVKAPDVFQVPLVINYDLPKAVEEYAHRVAPAISSSYSRAGVVINFVTATGGDVEMLRSIECFYKIKCPEVPMSLRDIV
ncbi:hypothetical protein BD410DRAFT_779720 [Rickenella mellea]|uniref:RNA helicase n=1 Tax=Rickenella mellea TaxID=50990 RepID=A0A4R5XE27_9AGAM|nr:hypothetical protein BD410DRAFT_779720 [Rickenella mellea]